MLLLGQYDSPYVRRVGIALHLYGVGFEHRPYSVFRDAEKLAAYNPLRKVPTLVDDDGTVLSETFVCLDVLDERVAALQPAARLLLPRTGPVRREGLRLGALCSGICEKNVALVYDRELHRPSNEFWTQRCQLQVRDGLLALESACAARSKEFLLGDELSHADIAAAVTLTFLVETAACNLEELALPALTELNARCEALPVFMVVRQPFNIPR